MKPPVQDPATGAHAHLVKEVLAVALLCLLAALSEHGISHPVSLPGPTWDDANITTTLLSGSSLFESFWHDFKRDASKISSHALLDSPTVSG